MVYYWCIASDCTNTSVKTPKKIFISVPTDTERRNKWLESVGRDSTKLAKGSHLYMCEDHFNLKQDMENYMQYKLMGSVKKIRMKPDSLPSYFEQERKDKNGKTGGSLDLHVSQKLEDVIEIPGVSEKSSLGIPRKGSRRKEVGNNFTDNTNNSQLHSLKENQITKNRKDVSTKSKKTSQGNNNISTEGESENVEIVYFIVDANKKSENNENIDENIQNEFKDSRTHFSSIENKFQDTLNTAENVNQQSIHEAYSKDCSTIEDYAEIDSKVFIEETTFNLNCVKKEVDDELYDFKDLHENRYRITLNFENLFGEASKGRNPKNDEDKLIGFENNDAVMELMTIKTENDIKTEDDIETDVDRNAVVADADTFYCNKCGRNYDGYCPNCSSLIHILNKTIQLQNSLFKAAKTSILEIRIALKRKGVFSLKTIPKNVIFGPFVGITTIESENRYMWRIVDKKFANVEMGNWMQYVACAKEGSLKNLSIFQFGGDLYFRSDREIKASEELLMGYGDIGTLTYSLKEFYFIPLKEEKFPKIFACTLCCLGFGLEKCLIEHKTKCPYAEGTRNIVDVIECHSCKIWLEKHEHLQYHMGYCWEKHYGILL